MCGRGIRGGARPLVHRLQHGGLPDSGRLNPPATAMDSATSAVQHSGEQATHDAELIAEILRRLKKEEEVAVGDLEGLEDASNVIGAGAFGEVRLVGRGAAKLSPNDVTRARGVAHRLRAARGRDALELGDLLLGEHSARGRSRRLRLESTRGAKERAERRADDACVGHVSRGGERGEKTRGGARE